MRKRAILLAGVAALLAVLSLSAAGIFDRAEQRSLDVRFSVRGEQPVRGITVVGIDEDTFNELDGVTWPLRRSLHADALDALRKAGAGQIIYDVQFTEPSQRPADDWALFTAIRRVGGVILATGEIDANGRTAVLGGEKNQRRFDAIAAAASFAQGDNGVIRHYEPAVAGVPTIAMATAERVDRVPEFFDGDGEALIDFRGPPGTIPTISFSDLVEGRVDHDVLRDQIIVIGGTAASLQDQHLTPMGGQMAGPEIQANAILTALDGNPLREAPAWLALLALLACGLAGAAVVFLSGAVRGAAMAAVLAAAYALGAQLAFNAGLVLPLAIPLIALFAGAIGSVLAATAIETALRRRTAWRNSELEVAVRERTEQLEASQVEIVERLARASELRDDDTGQHVDRMSQLCEQVALEMGRPAEEAAMLRRAAVLHDVGKLGLPDSILRKPGRLDDEELWEMRAHTVAGGALLEGSPSPILRLAEAIARTHHERWDGTGYPLGLEGEAIPLAGRIAAVCDVFDALVSVRPYKKAWPVSDAIAEIADQSGRHFDPLVAQALLKVIGRQVREPDWVASVDAQPERIVEAPARGDVTQQVPLG